RQVARLHDAGGGPDFFVHGVKDDPGFSVLYDPQHDNTAKSQESVSRRQAPVNPESDRPGDSIQLVGYEQMPVGTASSQPPGAPLAQPSQGAGPRGPVSAESLPELGVIVIRGANPADVEEVVRLVEYIQSLGALAEI